MSTFNGVLRALFDGILYPFQGMPRLVGLAVLALATALLVLLVYRTKSNQEGLTAVKRRIHACLLEIRLFNDDLRAILRAQMEILRHNLSYLKHHLRPLAWMIVPIVLIMAQMQFHYGYRGLGPGEQTLVKATLRAGSGPAVGPGPHRPQATLIAPEGLRVETPALWIPSLRELAWRIAAEREGSYELELRIDGETLTKTVEVSPRIVRRSPVRVSPAFLDQLVYPAERPLPAGGPVESITVGYAEDWTFLAVPGWMWIYFGLLALFAFVLMKRLGVTI